MDRSFPEVVLFDFFGTLVEYKRDWTVLAYPASHELVASWGSGLSHSAFIAAWEAAFAELESVAAATHEEHTMLAPAAAFGATCSPALTDAQCAELAEAFVVEWIAHVRPVPGAAGMVRRLAGRARLGVVSNTSDVSGVPGVLAAMGVADAFDLVLLSVEHGYRKPHPSIYERALAWFGVAADATVFVGDSLAADYLGPTAAGMSAYLIDPDGVHGVPDDRRLSSVVDVEDRL